MNDSSSVIPAIALDTASEEDLACRVQNGCADSFNELARRLQPRLFYLLRRRVSQMCDAEDLTQKTLLRAFEKIHLYNPAHKFCTWLFTIGIRLSVEHHRKRTLPTDGGGEKVAVVVDPQPTPDQQAITGEGAQQLWDLASRVLNTNQWTALWLLYGEGQSVTEIARTLDRTKVSVRVLLYRARKALVPHLAKFAEAVDESMTEVSVPIARQLARAES